MKHPSILTAQAMLRRNYQDLRFCPQDDAADLAAGKRRALDRLLEKRPAFEVLETAEEWAGLPYEDTALLNGGAEKLREAALARDTEENLLVAVNMGEHLQLMARGAQSEAPLLVSRVRELEGDLRDDAHPFAHSERFGFLSYRPALSGSGLHVSYLMHLPMLSFLRQIRPLAQAARAGQGCLLQEAAPSGRNPSRLFIISNLGSQGAQDLQVLQAVESFARQLDEKEGLLREKAVNQTRHSAALDQVWRAYGVLRHARRLPAGDYLSLWSSLRLGAAAGALPLSLKEADAMLRLAGDGAFREEGADPKTIPFRRADAVRRILSGGNHADFREI